MAYSADSFVADEQPTTAKWNKLWTNDASFNDGSGFQVGALKAPYVSNPYCFRAYAGGATTLTDATFVKIALSLESYDPEGDFASSAYTIPIDGIYHFDACVTHNTSTASGAEALTMIYANGSRIINGTDFPGFGAAGVWPVSGDYQCAAGDVIELYHYQDSAGNEAARAGNPYDTWMSGHLVHPL